MGFPNAYLQSNGQRNNQLQIFEQDRKTYERQQAEKAQMLNDAVQANNDIRYDLPSNINNPEVTEYKKSFIKLQRMLNGAEPANLKQAVFAVEDAYFGGKLNYSTFNGKIQRLIEIARMKATEDGYNWKDPLVRNVMLFRVLADKLTIKVPGKEGTITSYPMQYDFEDFMGEKDYTNMFVCKLLSSKTGQCHSLPLLYLILCEETGTQANLVFAPSHSYIKFKDIKGNWHNIELTNGHIVSDAYILGSGFIKAEALKNRIYMEPLDKKQTIAHCLNDLGLEYSHQFGYDKFISQCADTALKYHPTNLSARMSKANYQTARFEYVVNQVGRPHPDSLKTQYPKVYQLLQERNLTYQYIDRSGYQEMPKEAYQAWLRSIDKEKEKQKHRPKMIEYLTPIK